MGLFLCEERTDSDALRKPVGYTRLAKRPLIFSNASHAMSSGAHLDRKISYVPTM